MQLLSAALLGLGLGLLAGLGGAQRTSWCIESGILVGDELSFIEYTVDDWDKCQELCYAIRDKLGCAWFSWRRNELSDGRGNCKFYTDFGTLTEITNADTFTGPADCEGTPPDWEGTPVAAPTPKPTRDRSCMEYGMHKSPTGSHIASPYESAEDCWDTCGTSSVNCKHWAYVPATKRCYTAVGRVIKATNLEGSGTTEVYYGPDYCAEEEEEPTNEPTQSPTKSPTESPTQSPTDSPTQSPTQSPTESPTQAPTDSPTASPVAPTPNPTPAPTKDRSCIAPGVMALTNKESYTRTGGVTSAAMCQDYCERQNIAFTPGECDWFYWNESLSMCYMAAERGEISNVGSAGHWYGPNVCEGKKTQPTPEPTERGDIIIPFPPPRPTPQPTTDRVVVVTPAPTPRPTPEPTQAPTHSPTESPTKSPTPKPTASPIPAPTPGSGSGSSGVDYSCIKQGGLAGFPLGRHNYGYPTPESCMDLCRATNNCQWWAYRVKDQDCRMKTGKGNVWGTGNSNVRYGPRDCAMSP